MDSSLRSGRAALKLGLALISLCGSQQVGAFEYWPWFPQPLIPRIALGYEFQTFPKMSTLDDSLQHSEMAHTGRGTFELCATDEIDFQIEVALTETTAHGFFFDAAGLDLQYLFYNDVIGDPFSLALGGSLMVPSTTSKRDFATSHLGPIDFQLHLAVGKEQAAAGTWKRRMWAAGACTFSIRGAPQFWGKLAIDYNHRDLWWIETFLLGLYGLGERQLSAFIPFNGYGPFATRSVDVGLRLVKSFSNFGELAMTYRYRPFARNYPASAHFFCLTLWLPLSI